MYGSQIFFSHSVSYLFTLLILLLCRGFFEESQLFIFNLLVYACSVNPPKSLPRHMSRSFCPMFSSRIFMVSGLTFKSLIHFNLIFVKKEVPFHFFYMQISNFPQSLTEETAFSLFGITGSLVKY